MRAVFRILAPSILLVLIACSNTGQDEIEFPDQPVISDTARSYAELFFTECIERKNFSTIAELAESNLKRSCSRIFQSEGDYARCAQPILDWYVWRLVSETNDGLIMSRYDPFQTESPGINSCSMTTPIKKADMLVEAKDLLLSGSVGLFPSDLKEFELVVEVYEDDSVWCREFQDCAMLNFVVKPSPLELEAE